MSIFFRVGERRAMTINRLYAIAFKKKILEKKRLSRLGQFGREATEREHYSGTEAHVSSAGSTLSVHASKVGQ